MMDELQMLPQHISNGSMKSAWAKMHRLDRSSLMSELRAFHSNYRLERIRFEEVPYDQCP
jgi:hypothetical protein